LARKLSGLDATALLVGSMIGSGIFIAPSLMARNIAAPGIYLGLWLLAGLFMMLGAGSYAELAAMMPQAGGQYVYLRRAFGALPGTHSRKSATRQRWSGGTERCDEFEKSCKSSSGCEARLARGEPARASSEPCDGSGNATGEA
jgi:amino acid transporter